MASDTIRTAFAVPERHFRARAPGRLATHVLVPMFEQQEGHRESTLKADELYETCQEGWERTLGELTRELGGILAQAGLKATVRGRLKTLESFREKQTRAPYAPDSGGVPIADLLGVRVTVPFLEDIEAVVDALRARYGTVEVERKSESLSFREFAYDAVHVSLDVEAQLGDLQLPEGVPPVCEVQIRTCLQDAWAEVEHELIYKSIAFLPDPVVRKKLAALNANLMLADSIFQDLRDHQREQARWGNQRFNELKKKAVALEESEVDELPLASVESSQAAGKSLPTMPPPAQLLTGAIRAHNACDYRAAIAAYTRVLELESDPMTRSFTYDHRGMANFMLGNETEARKDFTAAAGSNPRNHRALNNRALAFRHVGVISEALKDFEASLAIHPHQPEVYFLMGQTFLELENRRDRARECLEEALRQDPDHREARELLRRCHSSE